MLTPAFARELTDSERRSLDLDGVVVLEGVIASAQLSHLRQRLDAFDAARETAAATDAEVRRRAARRLAISERVLRVARLLRGFA